MASLLEKLSAKGIKVFTSNPFWVEVGKPIEKVVPSENCVVMESTKFPGSFQLAIQEGESVVYIPLKRGTKTDLNEYTLQEFSASRDWPEYNITAGETRIFAI